MKYNEFNKIKEEIRIKLENTKYSIKNKQKLDTNKIIKHIELKSGKKTIFPQYTIKKEIEKDIEYLKQNIKNSIKRTSRKRSTEFEKHANKIINEAKMEIKKLNN